VQIEGSRVLLTGASGGLGQAIAKALAERGARLVVTGRRREVLDQLPGEPLVADLSKRADVEGLAERAGDVDIFVSNAGLPASGRLESFTTEEIDRALDVNLRAAIMVTHALIPGMVARGRGHLVYVSSMAGKVAPPRAAVYAATKYGLRGFALALGDDLEGTGVGVSAVFPGPIEDAGMWAEAEVKVRAGLRRRRPHHVGQAVVKAIETGRPEIDVADPIQKSGVILAEFAPRLLRRGKRLARVGQIADRTAQAQRAKR
jgi:uncharacterized protein